MLFAFARYSQSMKAHRELILGLVYMTLLSALGFFCMADYVSKYGAKCSVERIEHAKTLADLVTLEDARDLQESCSQGLTAEGLTSRRMDKTYVTSQNLAEIVQFYDSRLLGAGWKLEDDLGYSKVTPGRVQAFINSETDSQTEEIQQEDGLLFTYYTESKTEIAEYKLRLGTVPTSRGDLTVQLELRENHRKKVYFGP